MRIQIYTKFNASPLSHVHVVFAAGKNLIKMSPVWASPGFTSPARQGMYPQQMLEMVLCFQ